MSAKVGLTSTTEGHRKRVGSCIRSRRVDLGAKFRRKYHRRMAVRDRSDGHQILSDGRSSSDDQSGRQQMVNGRLNWRRQRTKGADLMCGRAFDDGVQI
jgi:hypothetical protein